jgi:hypothetical protein
LRRLLLQTLGNLEDLTRTFLATVSYAGFDPSEIPAIFELRDSKNIREMAAQHLAPVTAAIRALDSQAANEALLGMPTSPRIM